MQALLAVLLAGLKFESEPVFDPRMSKPMVPCWKGCKVRAASDCISRVRQPGRHGFCSGCHFTLSAEEHTQPLVQYLHLNSTGSSRASCHLRQPKNTPSAANTNRNRRLKRGEMRCTLITWICKKATPRMPLRPKAFFDTVDCLHRPQ